MVKAVCTVNMKAVVCVYVGGGGVEDVFTAVTVISAALDLVGHGLTAQPLTGCA